MSDFIQVTGWTSHNHPASHRSFQHLRSFSSSPSPRSPLKSTRPASSKSVSSSAVPRMAAVANAPGLPPSRHFRSFSEEDGSMSTLPDPRSRTMSPADDNGPSSPPQHPDLSNEVATLSNKLINSINHQTSLDDALSATRQELEAARQLIRVLERENREHTDMIKHGILVQSSIAEAEKARLRSSLMEEQRQRGEIEKEKKSIELELESLTTALFEEANKMVITARESAQKEHELLQHRNDQLKAQLDDTESLLKSHQEQLAELKQVIEQMTQEREDQADPTAPSTPGTSKFGNKDESVSESDTSNSGSIPEPLAPSYPTSFTHLLQTVLRTDLASFDEFTSLLRMSKNVPVGSRASSGSYGSLALGLGLGGYASSSQQGPSNGSTVSLSTGSTRGSSPATPTTPASTSSAGSSNGPNSLTPLKDTKFYKRTLAEDIEPVLRLDNAPGLSWLSKRAVLTAICDGTLVVEPMPVNYRHYAFPCSLCGESRKGAAHERNHRFRTNENENSQRYPLCKYCLGRIRSTCDFMGFLRILRDGHWRADDEESERAAWEESVRLRENMFWCRIGGGVVPIHHSHPEATHPHTGEDERKEQEEKLSEEIHRTGEIQPKDITPVPESARHSEVTPSHSLLEVSNNLEKTPKEIVTEASNNVENTPKEIVTVQTPAKEAEPADIVTLETPVKEAEPTEKEQEPTDHKEILAERLESPRDSVHSTSPLEVLPVEVSPVADPEKGEIKRLSITIPSIPDAF